MFMKAGPGDHDVFGFSASAQPGLHHSSWEVANIDQIAVGAQSMAEPGYRTGWGVGRPPLGSTVFHHFRDPWARCIEYFSRLALISQRWHARAGDNPPPPEGPRMRRR